MKLYDAAEAVVEEVIATERMCVWPGLIYKELTDGHVSAEPQTVLAIVNLLEPHPPPPSLLVTEIP